jgi:DNA modification methylase
MSTPQPQIESLEFTTKNKKKLEAIDWAFSSRTSGLDIESLHPYPAKFIEPIPGGILDSLNLPTDSTIFDPFCGSGTTLVAAQRRGFKSVGVDLNPIACLISRVKTSQTANSLIEIANDVVDQAKKIKNPQIPNIPNLDHWFTYEIQIAAAALLEVIGTKFQTEFFDSLRLALSSILVRVSNQESDTRYAAINKKYTTEDVYKLFLVSVKKIYDSLNTRSYQTTNSLVLENDVLKVKPIEIGLVDAVITSPPYPNAYEYWLYHKYRMWWLGFDPLAVKQAEIGARAHFFKKNRHTSDDFKRQMNGVFQLLTKVLKSHGTASIVIGRSKIHGVEINNSEIVRDAAELNGFIFELEIERPIAQNRKSFNLSHATIRNENIVIMRKK